MLARFWIGRTVFVGAFEVLEHELNGLQSEAVCKVVRQYGNVRFYGMGQYVQTGIGGYACRYGHGKRRIDNRNGRGQRVVGNRIFFVAVADDGKRSHFGACARCGRDADEFGFPAQFGEAERAFTDVHEFLHQVFKIDLRLLVEEPHGFGRVHRRAAAQRNNGVGLEAAHQIRAFIDGLDARIGFDIGKQLDGHFVFALVELVGDFIDKAQINHRTVCHDHDFFAVFHVLQILDGIAFKIDFGGHFEPLHVVSPTAYFFDV